MKNPTGHTHTHTQNIAKHSERYELKNFMKAEEVRDFPKGKVEVLNVGGITIGRATFQPGWKWSECLAPIAETDSCEAAHFGYQISGVMHIKMDNGQEFDCRPGDICLIPSGHDAWVVGKEPVVIVDFQGMMDYAKSPKGHKH